MHCFFNWQLESESQIQVQQIGQKEGVTKKMLNRGDRIGIVGCSDGLKKERAGQIEGLLKMLRQMGFSPVCSDYIYAIEGDFSGSWSERANALMDFYKDDSIKAIFDISGGDLANGVLPYLDYDVIGDSDKVFWGYSDLTAVINAIYTKTGKASVLYQIRNLLYDHGKQQAADFKNTVLNCRDDLFRINCEMLTAHTGMDGIVVGGNIRCFLKLAGTAYMPDLTDKILLLESYSGTAARMETYLCQLEQLGAFRKVSGILLGTFTEMEEKRCMPTIGMLIRKFTGDRIPVAVTRQIGHGTDAKGIWIGQEVSGMKLMSAAAPCKV